MAFDGGGGFKSTNRAPAMAHKRSMERKSQAGGAGIAERTDPLGQPGEEGAEDDGSQVAEEHGPATHVAMEHDHEQGMHSVHSMHPDGHEHHSEHGSAEEAHEHGKKLAGAGEEHEHEGDDEDDAEYE
jgi:hypothetical protein